MLDEWLIAVDTTTPFCVGARSGVGDYLRLIREFDVGCHCRRNVRPTRRFVMITSPHWLQHLHSDQRVRPIGILLREMKASLGQNVTNWSSLSETSDNARPHPSASNMSWCHWPKSPGTSRDGTSGPGECHPVYLNVLLPTILVLDCPHYDQRGYRSKRGSKDLSRRRVSNEVIPIERRGASEDCHPRIHVRPNASKVDVSETMHKTALSRSSFIGSSPARDDG